MDYKFVLHTQRNELIRKVQKHTLSLFMSGILSIYANVKKNNKIKKHLLKEFQRSMVDITLWSQEILKNEHARLTTIFPMYDKIVTKIFKIQSNLHGRDVPSIDCKDFMHQCYLNIARSVWKQPFLVYDVGVEKLIIQKNHLKLEKLVMDGVRDTFEHFLPIDDDYDEITLDEQSKSADLDFSATESHIDGYCEESKSKETIHVTPQEQFDFVEQHEGQPNNDIVGDDDIEDSVDSEDNEEPEDIEQSEDNEYEDNEHIEEPEDLEDLEEIEEIEEQEDREDEVNDGDTAFNVHKEEDGDENSSASDYEDDTYFDKSDNGDVQDIENIDEDFDDDGLNVDMLNIEKHNHFIEPSTPVHEVVKHVSNTHISSIPSIPFVDTENDVEEHRNTHSTPNQNEVKNIDLTQSFHQPVPTPDDVMMSPSKDIKVVTFEEKAGKVKSLLTLKKKVKTSMMNTHLHNPSFF